MKGGRLSTPSLPAVPCCAGWLAGELCGGAQLGELAALYLIDVHVTGLDVAVVLELHLLGDAIEAVEGLDEGQQLLAGVVARLDALDEDVGGVVALARVRARVLA